MKYMLVKIYSYEVTSVFLYFYFSISLYSIVLCCCSLINISSVTYWIRLRRLLRITRRDRLSETVRSTLQQERTSNMFQGWELRSINIKQSAMETTKKVNSQCKGGHGEENFISNDL